MRLSTSRDDLVSVVFGNGPPFHKLSGRSLRTLLLALAATACGPDIDNAIEPVDESLEAVSVNGRLHTQDYLFEGQRIWSEGGGFMMKMQSDGNLVIRDALGNPIWSTGTSGGNAFVTLQGDGNFVVRAWNDSLLWASNTSNADNVRLGTIGQLGVYGGNTQRWWNGVTWQPSAWDSGARSEVTHIYHHKSFASGYAVLETSSNKSSQCGTRCAARFDCSAWTWDPNGNICRLLDRRTSLVNKTGWHAGEKIVCYVSSNSCSTLN
jgi:hypothetical protein